MSSDHVALQARRVQFLSDHDEGGFFEWLRKLPCLDEVFGEGDTVKITVRRDRVDDDCLRELIALFYRYDIDLKQLGTFKNESNEKWLTRSSSYWFQKMFGGE